MPERKTSVQWFPNKYLCLLLTLIFIGSLVGFCLFAFIAWLNSSSVHFSSAPVESLLNPDGTLKLNIGFVGTLDLHGWNVKFDSKRGPVLTPQLITPQYIALPSTSYGHITQYNRLANISQANSW